MGPTILHFLTSSQVTLMLLFYRSHVAQPGSPAQELFSTMDRRPPPTNQQTFVSPQVFGLSAKQMAPLRRTFQKVPDHAECSSLLSLSPPLIGRTLGLEQSVPQPRTGTWSRGLGSLRSSAHRRWSSSSHISPDSPGLLQVLPGDSLWLCLYLGSCRKDSECTSLTSSFWWMPTPTLLLSLNDEAAFLPCVYSSYPLLEL